MCNGLVAFLSPAPLCEAENTTAGCGCCILLYFFCCCTLPLLHVAASGRQQACGAVRPGCLPPSRSSPAVQLPSPSLGVGTGTVTHLLPLEHVHLVTWQSAELV